MPFVPTWFIVYDLLNSQLLKLPLPSKKEELNFNCEKLTSGLYLFKIVGYNEMISYGKFNIIKRK